MKRFTLAMMTLVFAMVMPMMDHNAHGKEMAHDMDTKNGHFTEIGEDTTEGVVATVKVKAYDEEAMETMANMGMNATHHVMVFFTDETSGEPIASGKAAIRIKDPKDHKTTMLMRMGSGFGGDVYVEKGMSIFEIRKRLENGRTLRFEVTFHNM